MKCLQSLKHIPQVLEGLSHREGIPETIQYITKSICGYIIPEQNSIRGRHSTTNIFVPGFVSTGKTMKTLGDLCRKNGENSLYVQNPRYMNFESVNKRMDAIEREIELVKTVCPNTTIRLIGHSMGGHLSLRLAQEYSDIIDEIIVISGACQEVAHAKYFSFIPSLKDLSRFQELDVVESVKTTIFVALHDSLISTTSQVPKDPKHAKIIELPTNHINILSDPWAHKIIENI